MSNSTPPRRPGVRRVAINGRFLDEVQTRVEDDRGGSVIHTSYPAEQHGRFCAACRVLACAFGVCGALRKLRVSSGAYCG
jgi:hypothetical protein